MSVAMSSRTHPAADDPRRLRDVIGRVQALAAEHAVSSVVVGFAAREGDRLFPDFVSFVESELRVEDSIFRLTRERALLFLTDCDPHQARSVVERLTDGFLREFPAASAPPMQVRYLEITPTGEELSVKQVLPAVFADGSETS
jgi:hypothetical protein